MVFDVVLDMVSSNLHDGHEGNHRLREANKDTAKRVAFYSRQLLSAIIEDPFCHHGNARLDAVCIDLGA